MIQNRINILNRAAKYKIFKIENLKVLKKKLFHILNLELFNQEHKKENKYNVLLKVILNKN